MSLQIWLPLNGNLNNLGLRGDVLPVATGTTIVSAGKIGSCYHFGTATSYITIPKEAMTSFTTEASVCFWFKIISWNTSYATFFQAGLGSNPWAHYIFGFLRNSTSSTCCFTISNGSSASDASYVTPTFDLNRWYHIALVYKTGHCLIYIDGELYKDYTTSIVPNFSGITTITTGISNNKSSYQTNCQMNDLRIYDHVLSEKEVKEISRGLIVNYKLDGNGLNNENLFKNSSLSNLTTTNLNSKLRYSSTYPPEITSDGIKFTWSGSSAREVGLWLNKSLKVDTDYTLSFVYKSNMQIDSSFYLRNGNTLVGYWSQTTIPQATDWTYYTCTFKPVSYQSGDITTGNSLTLFYSAYAENKWIELKQNSIKLEEGTDATTWCPSTNDIEYLNQQNNTIFDDSGYCNNGTLVGSLTTIYSSARYNNSSYFEDYTTYIQRNMGSIIPDSITMSCWIKGTNKSAKGGYHIPLNMHGTNFEISIASSSGKVRMGYVVGGTRYISDIGPDILDGQWHMLTSTFDGATICRYVDGILIHSEERTGALTSLSTLGVGNFPGGTTYGNTQLYESDVRVYVTALSAEDILELYHTGESIDKAGNLYAYEFYEDDNASISTGKNGVVTAKEYDNQENLTSFYKTGQIYTNELKEI